MPGKNPRSAVAHDTSTGPGQPHLRGRADRDPAEALLGSVSQRLLLESPVPVAAVQLRRAQGDSD